jgi:hypothetical protein
MKIIFRAWVGVPSIRMKPMTIVYYGNECLFSMEQAVILTFICLRATLSYDLAHRAVRS